jgi:hypothetical protein
VALDLEMIDIDGVKATERLLKAIGDEHGIRLVDTGLGRNACHRVISVHR